MILLALSLSKGEGYRKKSKPREAFVTQHPKGGVQKLQPPYTASRLARGKQIHGKEINDHKGEPRAEIFVTDGPPLLQMWPSPRLYARFQSLPHLLPRRGIRRQHPRHKKIFMVNTNLQINTNLRMTANKMHAYSLPFVAFASAPHSDIW